MAKGKTYWLSAPPESCDICGISIKEEFVDGKTALGPWACMCLGCHRDSGGKLGLGLGQKYKLDGTRWPKVAG